MESNSLRFLLQLLETASPSGHESETAGIWRTEAATFADEVEDDTMGNLYARLRGSGPQIILEAHIDEIGLLITHVDVHGICWVAPLGRWDPQILAGQRVRILGRQGPVHGVVGCIPVNRLERSQEVKQAKISDLWVDIGSTDRSGTLSRVAIGDAAVLDQPPLLLNGDFVVGRGLDNRVGAWVILEALRKLSQDRHHIAADVWAVACVQEETGYGGAVVAARHLAPDMAICVDAWHASDDPEADERVLGECRLGSGPAINRSPLLSSDLCDRLAAIAQSLDLPHTFHASPDADDAAVFAVAGSGVASAEVGIPTRYMHSPNEMCRLADLDAAVRLCAEFTRSQCSGAPAAVAADGPDDGGRQ